MPVRDDDNVIDHATLDAKIRRGIEEYEQNKVYRMNEGEKIDAFLDRLINED